MTEKEKKTAAKRFAETWANRGDEKQETQVFWISLLREVFGVEAPEKIIQFEKRAIDVSRKDAKIGGRRILASGKWNGKYPLRRRWKRRPPRRCPPKRRPPQKVTSLW